jgi:flagellar hook-associated protein 2
MATSGTSITSTASSSLMTLVNQMMASDRQPVTQWQNQKTSLQSKIKIYQSLGSKLSSLLTLSRSFAGTGSLSPLKQVAVSGLDSSILEAKADSGATFGDHTVDVKQLAARHGLAGEVVQAGDKAKVAGGSEDSGNDGSLSVNRFRFVVGDASVEIELSRTSGLTQLELLTQVAKAINDKNGAVSASVIDTGGGGRRLLIQSNVAGQAGRITAVEDLKGNLMRTLKLAGGSNKNGTLSSTVREGQDAIIVVDGVQISSAENTFKNVLPGLTLTAKSAVGGAQTMTVAPDEDAMVKKIQDFISQFNKALDEVRSDTQGADSTGSNRGPLTGEPSFLRLRAALREAVMRPVAGGAISSLAQIGITASREGNLSLEKEDTLRTAIRDNPDAVIGLWNAAGGIAERLTSLLNLYSKTGGILSRQQEAANASIRSIDSRVSSTNKVLSNKQDLLLQQLASIQATVGSLTSQQQYLSGLLSSSDQLFA